MIHARTFRALALSPEARSPLGPPAPVPLHLHGWRGASPGELLRLTRARSATELCWPEEGDPRISRKESLRRAEARLGPTGLGLLDLEARRVWSREALAAELDHEADLDVLHLFHAHVVRGTRSWLHTHGLAEAGGLDVEVLDPGVGLLEGVDEFLRRMGEAVLGGEVDEGTRMFWLGADAGWVQLVPLDEFQAAAPLDLRRLRSPDVPGHGGARRRVLCEADSFRLRPAAALRGERPMVFEVGPADYARRDARGRATAPQARKMMAELGELIRSSWVEVEEASGSRWLELEKWDRSHLGGRELDGGEPRAATWEQVVNWCLVTDVGEVTPWDSTPARHLREVLEELAVGPPLH